MRRVTGAADVPAVILDLGDEAFASTAQRVREILG